LVSSTDTDFDLAGCSAAPCTSHHTGAVTCPGSTLLLSGGATSVGESSGPFGDGGDVEIHNSWPASTQTWAVDVTSINGATHVDLTVWAICTA
jgi:hypothetical protein